VQGFLKPAHKRLITKTTRRTSITITPPAITPFLKAGIFAPILTKISNVSGLNFVDPLPQALVLTAIVIGMGTTALSLAFARQIYAKYQTFDLNEMEVEA
jgi:multisubunit Na+/H+ antiporter MnhC subunit